MGEKRGTAPYFLHQYEGREERESGNGTTNQTGTKSSGSQFKMSHAQQHAHDKTPSQPFPNKAVSARFPTRSAQQWTRCLIGCSPNNRKQPFSATVWLLLSCRSIDVSQKCGIAVHNWLLVNWRNTNHTSLLARPFVLKVQHYENATQNTQSRRTKGN